MKGKVVYIAVLVVVGVFLFRTARASIGKIQARQSAAMP